MAITNATIDLASDITDSALAVSNTTELNTAGTTTGVNTMTIYFDRTLPMYLTSEPSYNGIAVNIDTEALQFVIDMNQLLTQMEARINESGAPEEYNQELAEQYVAGLNEIWENHSVRPETRPIASFTPDPSPSVPTEGD